MYKRVTINFNKKVYARPAKKVEIKCKGCNIKFQVTELLANEGRKYCTRECYLKWLWLRDINK